MGMRESLWDRVLRPATIGILPLLAVVMMTPLVSALALSLNSKAASDMGVVNLLSVGFTSDSWRYILFNGDIWRAFFITVVAMVSGVVLSLAIISPFVYPFSKKEFKTPKLLTIVALITMVPKAPVVPYFLTLKNIGLFNNPLVLVLPQISTTYNTIIMRSSFQQFSKEVEEAVTIGGASRFKVFYQIVSPSSKAVLATVGLFYGVTLWNQFQHPMMLIQDMKPFPPQMKVRQLTGSGSGLQNVAASINVNYSDRILQAIIVVFAILLIIVVYLFIQRYSTEGVTLGSAKG